MIDIQSASFEYPAREGEARLAVNKATLRVDDGEYVAILGRNGSGKSTLAKLMNALLSPTDGAVFVNGLDTRAEENIWDVRRAAGMVFQNPDNQIVATIVEDDVAFGAENLGLPPSEIRRRVDWALGVVGMGEYANHAPHLLSGGQKQRVAIAGVLAMKPGVIVLDEPTAMLDPSGRKEVLGAVAKLNQDEGMTVILITHFMDEAAAAGRVVVMDSGRVIMDGAPKDIFSRAAELKALGLDVPQVTEIAGLLRGRGVSLPEGILTVDDMVAAIGGIVTRGGARD